MTRPFDLRWRRLTCFTSFAQTSRDEWHRGQVRVLTLNPRGFVNLIDCHIA